MTLARKLPVKSARRVSIVDAIVSGMTANRVIKRIGFHTKTESEIATAMFIFLGEQLEVIHRELAPDQMDVTIERKAEASLFWEGSPDTTVNNVQVYGVAHRPDFIVQIDDVRIAIELKRGETGAAIREGLGQSLVYSQVFDFIVYCFVDTSRDGKIRRGAAEPGELQLSQHLWDYFNVRFVVI